eukprot:1144759-Pelagomonas_calceolata.AAC.1
MSCKGCLRWHQISCAMPHHGGHVRINTDTNPFSKLQSEICGCGCASLPWSARAMKYLKIWSRRALAERKRKRKDY